MQRWIPVALLLTLAACGGGSSPAAPTPTPTPTPTTFTLTGTVTSTTGGAISGATVKIGDGANVGKSATTNSAGSYSMTGLAQSGFTVTASATNYVSDSAGLTLTSNQTQDFHLVPTPLFTRSGVGNTVFDMPTTVARVHITGDFTGFCCSNFIVHIGGQSIVNVIIGPDTSFTSGTHYDAIALTTGGVVEIVNSDAVRWSFTEVRQ